MPPQEDLTRRLSDLLVDPRETLEVELKGWLDLTNNDTHRAKLAKAIIALANHGGGFIIFGFDETNGAVRVAGDRPENLSSFTPDRINSAVNRYVEPPFHCDVQIIKSSADELDYPIIIVPGGHKVPVRSKRNGPNDQEIKQNIYYTRRPGPQSEPPQSGQEWDLLLRRCITNARNDLLDSFRLLMSGGSPVTAATETDQDRLEKWLEVSFTRWKELTENLPENRPARLRNGHYSVGYQLLGDFEPVRGRKLLETLQAGVVRHTGWPPFWVPTREGIAPYLVNDCVECWLGGDGKEQDPDHADFWRASPEGQFYLLRGYQEDGLENREIMPGEIFDLTLPTWRVGEILLHAESMARQFMAPQAQLLILAEWTGLSGRKISSFANPINQPIDSPIAHQDIYRTKIKVQANQISDTLPELVDSIVRPLYELFNFFQLPAGLVTQELARMRQHRF